MLHNLIRFSSYSLLTYCIFNSGAQAQTSQSESAPPTSIKTKANFVASYGDNPISLLLTPSERKEYLRYIMLYEREGYDPSTISEEERNALGITDEMLDADAIDEPPIFYAHYPLSSIIYDTPNHWSVTINGIQINNENNQRDKELYVKSITRTHARFVWTPQDGRIVPSLRESMRDKTIDAIPETIKHRLVLPEHKSHATYMTDNSISFTLEPNQFFASGYMHILEGNSEALAPITYFPSGDPNAVVDINIQLDDAPPSPPTDEGIISERDYLEGRSKKSTAEERILDAVEGL